MKKSRSLRSALLICMLVSPGLARAQGLSSEKVNSLDGSLQEIDRGQKSKLSPGAAEVAGLMGVAELIYQLERLPQSGGMSLEELTLRQEITEAALGTSLEVDGVIAEIESEVAQISEIRAYLEARRDHAIGINALSNIVTGGALGIVGSALQFKESTNTVGNAVGVAAGGVTTVLSALGLRRQHGGRHALGTAPNMLARIFDRPAEFHSDYPREVWTYLNSVAPSDGGAETRRSQLIKEWIELGRIERPDSEKGRSKVELLTSPISTQRELTIGLLTDREAMLSDVRTRVALMKRDLSKLMRWLPFRKLAPGQPPGS
jgi:hypothetical protein